jgi:hypothetical protein
MAGELSLDADVETVRTEVYVGRGVEVKVGAVVPEVAATLTGAVGSGVTVGSAVGVGATFEGVEVVQHPATARAHIRRHTMRRRARIRRTCCAED